MVSVDGELTSPQGPSEGLERLDKGEALGFGGTESSFTMIFPPRAPVLDNTIGHLGIIVRLLQAHTYSVIGGCVDLEDEGLGAVGGCKDRCCDKSVFQRFHCFLELGGEASFGWIYTSTSRISERTGDEGEVLDEPPEVASHSEERSHLLKSVHLFSLEVVDHLHLGWIWTEPFAAKEMSQVFDLSTEEVTLVRSTRQIG